MRGDEILASKDLEPRQKTRQVASWLHLAGFLLIGAGVVAMGFLAQHSSTGGGGPTAPGQLGSHSQAIHIYLVAILMDWALLYYCWAGVHHRGGGLGTISGGRWTSWKSAAVDLGIVVPFWALWESSAYAVHLLLGPSSAKTVDSLLPQSFLEVLLWIATSITAGFCEEIAFRGYLQRQFHALSGSAAAAVLAQGLVFGLFHSYQGWKNVIVIFVLGVLYGMLAAWRKNLRANIVAHAFSDIWEGWLKFVVWR
jgi:membrane protease YdiL (CAAX protease family)